MRAAPAAEAVVVMKFLRENCADRVKVSSSMRDVRAMWILYTLLLARQLQQGRSAGPLPSATNKLKGAKPSVNDSNSPLPYIVWVLVRSAVGVIGGASSGCDPFRSAW